MSRKKSLSKPRRSSSRTAGSGVGKVFKGLAKDLSHDDPELRTTALNRLSFFGPDAKPLILLVVKALIDDVPSVREAAKHCLTAISPGAGRLPGLPNLVATHQKGLRLSALREMVIRLPEVLEAIASRQAGHEDLAGLVPLTEKGMAPSEFKEHTGAEAANGLPGVRMHRSHLIRIPDRECRKQAVGLLVALEESWVRLPGNVLGVSTRQVEALASHGVLFDWVSKDPAHA